MTLHIELAKAITTAKATPQISVLLSPLSSSAIFKALAKQGIKKMRILAAHT